MKKEDFGDSLHFKLTDYQAHVIFGDRELLWDMSCFIPSSFRGEFDLFAQLNKYLLRVDRKTQEKMFECYEFIHGIFNRTDNVDAAILTLQPVAKDLSNMFDHKDLIKWVEIGSKNEINIPTSFMEEFSTDPNKAGGRRIVQGSTPQMTYLRRDYIELVGFAVFTRAFLPIWGSFIYKYGSQVGTIFKEMEAGGLFVGSKVTETAAYKKLQMYQDAYVNYERIRGPAQLEGLSSEDLRNWVFYLIMVRRVAIGDIRGIGNPDTHLVSSIHNYIKNRINSYDTNFTHGRITSKTPRITSDTENDRASVIEAFRINYTFPPGTIEEFSVYARDTEAIIETLCPTLDRAVLKQAFDASQVLMREEVPLPQVYIASWIIGPYLHPRTLMYLTQVDVVHILAICQAILWTNGFEELAIFLSCTEMKTAQGQVFHMSGFGSRSTIPRSLQEEMSKSYPHMRRPNGPVPNPRTESIQMMALKHIVTLIQESSWKMNCHPSWISKLGLNKDVAGRQAEFIVPSDIRAKLAQLAIKIAERDRPFAIELDPSQSQ